MENRACARPHCSKRIRIRKIVPMAASNKLHSPLRLNFGVALGALIASGGTLVCCVLPAVLVALGADAVLAAWSPHFRN